MTDNIVFMQHWFREVWWKQSTEAIDALFAPGGHAQGVGTEAVDHVEYKAFHQALLGLIDEVDIQIVESMVDGDRVMAKTMVTAAQRSTRKPVSFGGVVLCTVVQSDRGPQIKDAENYFDFLGLFEQLGLLDQGVFARCLSGQAM